VKEATGALDKVEGNEDKLSDKSIKGAEELPKAIRGIALGATDKENNGHVSGNIEDSTELNELYSGIEVIDLEGSPEGVNEVLGNKLEPMGSELEATNASFELASGKAELDKGNILGATSEDCRGKELV